MDSLDPESASTLQRMRTSKSDTSLTDSFVMVSGDGTVVDEDGRDKSSARSVRRTISAHNTLNVLREGLFLILLLLTSAD